MHYVMASNLNNFLYQTFMIVLLRFSLVEQSDSKYVCIVLLLFPFFAKLSVVSTEYLTSTKILDNAQAQKYQVINRVHCKVVRKEHCIFNLYGYISRKILDL